ncbi:MAG: hypothetical protein IJV96_00200 [Clostridia bacterium]|nr:hypothetical protein [Clostridia bacterium]
MLTNKQFLEVIRESFFTYLKIDTSRSTAKLKTLHGHIAQDLQELFGKDYTIQSQGYSDDKEGVIDGRYYPKNVDITVSYKGKPVAGYAVKFVMRNYSQNSNNYFENMLGETANIRSNNIPYFQMFIIFDKVPYYKSGGIFSKYDIITQHNLDKYFALSKDNPDAFYHTPDKTLLVLLTLKEKSPNFTFASSQDYASYYMSIIKDNDLISYSTKIKDTFNDSVVFNNYADFIRRTYYLVEGKRKA